MQSFPNSLDKGPVDHHGRLWSFQQSIEGPCDIDNVFLFLQFPQIGYFPGVEYVVDIFQKDLIDDLVVSKEEGRPYILIRALPHHTLQKHPERVNIVAFGYLHLFDLVPRNIRC
jgi:hypothetical protein